MQNSRQNADDPLAVIASPPPSLSADEARELALDHYGLKASTRTLISERDLNFRLTADDGRRFVLKIANSAEDPAVTDFQIQALLHIERYRAEYPGPLNAPVVVPTLRGETHFNLDIDDNKHVVRVVSYLEGIPLANVQPTAALCRQLGVQLANLGQALKDFDHAGADQDLLWDMQKASQLRRLVAHIGDGALRYAVSLSLDEFEDKALPAFADFRRQVIHNDFNPDNALVHSDIPDQVAGVIDFGDMLRSPLVADVAIGASYLRAAGGDPIEHILPFLAGYHSVTPLGVEELDVVREMIMARLCATITILAWRQAARGADDPYLQRSSEGESTAGRFLERLRQLPADDFDAAVKRELRQ